MAPLHRLDLADHLDPWEKQPKEMADSFEAFNEYRSTPAKDRRGKLSRMHEERKGRVFAWSARNRWVERVAAWDAHLEREARQVEVDAVKEMRRRHIDIAKAMQFVGANEIAKFAKRSQRKQDEPVVTVREAVELAEHGLRIERLNRGEPETHDKTDLRVEGEVTWADLAKALHDERARNSEVSRTNTPKKH